MRRPVFGCGGAGNSGSAGDECMPGIKETNKE